MTNKQRLGSVELGQLSLNLEDGTLLYLQHSVRLQPLQSKLLAYFIEHSNQLISPQLLFENVWGTQYKSESSLARTVSELRKYLLEIDNKEVTIENIPRRGYRLIYSANLEQKSDKSLSSKYVVKKYLSFISLLLLIILGVWYINLSSVEPLTISTQPILMQIDLEEITHNFTDTKELKVISILEQDMLEQLRVRTGTNIIWRGKRINPIGTEIYQNKFIIKWQLQAIDMKIRLGIGIVKAGGEQSIWSKEFSSFKQLELQSQKTVIALLRYMDSI